MVWLAPEVIVPADRDGEGLTIRLEVSAGFEVITVSVSVPFRFQVTLICVSPVPLEEPLIVPPAADQFTIVLPVKLLPTSAYSYCVAVAIQVGPAINPDCPGGQT